MILLIMTIVSLIECSFFFFLSPPPPPPPPLQTLIFIITMTKVPMVDHSNRDDTLVLQESLMQDMLARQMAASVNSAVFPGLPPHIPLYASTPTPSLPALNPLPPSKEASALPGGSEDAGGGYVQHLQSEYGKLCRRVDPEQGGEG